MRVHGGSARGVSACDVVLCAGVSARQLSVGFGESESNRASNTRAGDLWNTCSAGERSPDKNRNCLNMSGDNEETQTAEETPVEEKVNAGFSSRAPGTVASW